MGFDVFVVHASSDKRIARSLIGALEATGVTAFLDQFHAEAGKPWDDGIRRALDESLVQVILLGASDRWYQSEEIDLAIKRMRALGADDRLIPVLLAPRESLPYGLNRVQALQWEGADQVARQVAERVATLRGGRLVKGTLVKASRSVRIGVLGFWDDMRDPLEALRQRLSQRTAMLDGEVRRVDLVHDWPLETPLDLYVLLLAHRHHDQLEVLEKLVEAARKMDAADLSVPGTVVGALAINLRNVPKEHRHETLAVQDLHDRLDVVCDSAAEAIEALDERVSGWFAARFPSRPGHSIARETWEERYLRDKTPLWRRGDPSAIRPQAGGRAERVQWYVHLKAAPPWFSVENEVRHEVSMGLKGTPVGVGEGACAEVCIRSGDRAEAVPKDLWLARFDPSDSMYSHHDGSAAFRNCEKTTSQPWLDSVLSHRLLPRCVIVGQPGTGKTVLLQHLAWVLSTSDQGEEQPEPDAAHHVDRPGVAAGSPIPPIPVLHTAATVVSHLRAGGGVRPIRETLVELLRASDTFGDGADVSILRGGLDCGRYVFLIDSLDEVPRREDRQALVDALGALDGSAPRVILTTRPSIHTDVELPAGFARVDIAALDRHMADRFVYAWVNTWAPNEDLKSIRTAVSRVRRSFPSTTDEQSPVENPLLLGCVLQVYVAYRRLPDDTAKLYSDMVRVLCEAKIRAADDLQKDSMAERYREALRELFLATQERGGTRLPIADARDLLVDHRFVSRDGVDNWLQTLANHTGLIRFEGRSDGALMRPWHRSYQEYLAAEGIALRFASRAKACVNWLLTPREDQPLRVLDSAWRGALAFLVGATVHQSRSWAIGLLMALAKAATAASKHQARLWALCATATAEYAQTFFANEDFRLALPILLVAAFDRDGRDWPVVDRLEALDAVGRLGDPRLPDPRAVTIFDLSTGWLFVPPGDYVTGLPISGETSRRAVRRAKRLGGGFWIRRWPVLTAEFLAFVEESADLPANLVESWRRQARNPNRPIVNIDWYVARQFCRWAQRRWALPCDGGELDLPTSTEWEVAARGNTERAFPWGDADPGRGDQAAASYFWIGAESQIFGPTPVGAFPRGHSPEGLWDISGNVFELCSSMYRGPEDVDVGVDQLPLPGVEMVYRGGSWRRSSDALFAARRGDHPPSLYSDDTGFRVICRPRKTVT